MDNTSWYRVSKDITLINGESIKVYQTVFETSDYSLSEESVEWCMKAMDRKTDGKTEEPKKCDSCKHEKERWFSRCADCTDYELWEGNQCQR